MVSIPTVFPNNFPAVRTKSCPVESAFRPRRWSLSSWLSPPNEFTILFYQVCVCNVLYPLAHHRVSSSCFIKLKVASHILFQTHSLARLPVADGHQLPLVVVVVVVVIVLCAILTSHGS